MVFLDQMHSTLVQHRLGRRLRATSGKDLPALLGWDPAAILSASKTACASSVANDTETPPSSDLNDLTPGVRRWRAALMPALRDGRKRRLQARNRWLLAAALLTNPALRGGRKRPGEGPNDDEDEKERSRHSLVHGVVGADDVALFAGVVASAGGPGDAGSG
jgi:hypothetical protein